MLFAVMIIIGGVTYTLVLNLEHVAQSTNDCYNVLKKQVLKPMKKDTAKAWKDRAKKYEVFKPLSTNTKPSEWWVLWYIVFWPFNALKTQVQKAWNRLRHTPNPSANTTPDKKKTSPSANEDWIENFPKIAHEAEIPVQASQDHIDENNNTAPLIIEVKWVPA